MALHFDEMVQCYSSLTDLSKRYGLNWVIEQVESQIAVQARLEAARFEREKSL